MPTATPPFVRLDPDVMGGTPVLFGSRLPVATLLACVDAGDNLERLVESWPFLTPAHIEAARAYAELNDVSIRPWVADAFSRATKPDGSEMPPQP